MLQRIENEIRVGKCKIRKPSKHADNQYTLISTDDGRFFAFFKDGEGNDQLSEISKDLYQEMLQQARKDEAYLRWNRRHLDDESIIDELPDSRGSNIRGVEDVVIAKVLLDDESPARKAVTDLQWRRLSLYYSLEFTLDEIAKLEGCNYQAIQNTILKAKEILKKFI